MSVYDNIQEIKSEIENCMKCGNCMAVCPVYGETTSESQVARGKIVLIEAFLSGKIDATPGLYERLSHCLVCKSCMVNCPCGVKVDKIILAARAEIIRKKGLHPLKKAIFTVMKSPSVFNLGLKAGSIAQGLLFKRHPKRKAFYPPAIPMGLDKGRILPSISLKSFRDSMPEVVKVDNPVQRVAFFTGCSTNYMYPQIGEATVNVLKENKVEVVIPKVQNCCGLAIFASGDIETARNLAKANVDIFADLNVDAYITACGSCGGTMKHEWHELLHDDPVYGPKLERMIAKTYDVSEFLVDVLNYRRPTGSVDMSVTYHDSCHLRKCQGVIKQPRQILQDIKGVDFIEMKKPDACCGCGGSFSIIYYDSALGIVKKKVEDANSTGAQNIVTGCPGCAMHIEDGVNRFGRNQEVLHTVQILEQAYNNEKH